MSFTGKVKDAWQALNTVGVFVSLILNLGLHERWLRFPLRNCLGRKCCHELILERQCHSTQVQLGCVNVGAGELS